ncbi:MAG: HAD family hydrolase [Oscillospiraceae bacterium]|jgi:putative hydrolase of the HAD superfamily|nr:HAD family hydrolase [Oscillospiraceae bacterium]
MRRPKMILFDYGHTLLAEPDYDSLRGTYAVMAHCVQNPRGLSPEEVDRFAGEVFRGICGPARDIGLEIHEYQFDRLTYEYLELTFSVGAAARERLYWDNAAPGVRMPYIGEALSYLREQGIRSGVISNIAFSGAALRERIGRLLPEHAFEFVLASSEYMIRKPHPLLFELALRKAGLPPEDVRFCGDTVRCDVAGAAGAGIFPVWYEDRTLDNPFREPAGNPPVGPHLHITDWREFPPALECCQS